MLDEGKGNIAPLEKRDWELWYIAFLIFLGLLLYVLISQIWEISGSPREWFRVFLSAKTHWTGLTFLVLLFCLYAILKNMGPRWLRKQIIIQRSELEHISGSLEEVAAIYQISSAIHAKQSLDTILDSIVRESLRCLNADRCTFYGMDDPGGFLKRKISHVSNPLDERVDLSDEKEVARKAILQNRPFLLGQPEDFANFFNYSARERRIISLMNIPICLNDKPTAVLSVVRINGESRFHEADLKLFSIFGNHASIATENSHLSEEVRRKSGWRKQFDKYYTNLMDLLQDLSEEERGKVEAYVKSLMSKKRNQAQERITLVGELGAENRQDERLDEIFQVEFEDNSIAQTANISRGGAFIHTPHPLDLEEEFLLKLKIPDGGEPMEVRCRVVWMNRYGKAREGLPHGMGVRFVGLRDDLRRRIEEFIEMQKSKDLTPLPLLSAGTIEKSA